MTRAVQFFFSFSVLLGILESVCCGNYSINSYSSQLNQKIELESARLSKANICESLPERKIIKRQLLFNEDPNSAVSLDRESENKAYTISRSNFSEPKNDKMSDWGNLRLQFPSPNNPENSHNFADIRVRQPFRGVKKSNQKYNWEKSDFFEKSPTRWNGENSYKKDFTDRNNYNGRPSGVINDDEISREDRRGDVSERTSMAALNEAELRNIKNYNDDRVGDIYSGHRGHSNLNHYNGRPNSFWRSNFYKPEKGVVINLNTECSAPRQFSNQLVHKFIFTPKSPINMHSEFSGYHIPESGFVSSHQMTPMYYL